jgi:LysM repeat protein
MNSPLIPQGSLLEQKSKSQSRVKIAFYTVVGLHATAFCVALLVQGCKREQPLPPQETIEPTYVETNLPPAEPNFPPYNEPTSAPPPQIEVPSVPPPVTPTVTEYTVEAGDTFSSIGKKLGVSWKAIQNANPNIEPTKLRIGQKIVIPPATTVLPGPTTPPTTESGELLYEVKSGDTLSGIARRHGTTVNALRAANGLVTDRIIVGQKLKIPGKSEAPMTAPPAAAEPIPTLPPPTTVPQSQ